jgi:hypothetical protein
MNFWSSQIGGNVYKKVRIVVLIRWKRYHMAICMTTLVGQNFTVFRILLHEDISLLSHVVSYWVPGQRCDELIAVDNTFLQRLGN